MIDDLAQYDFIDFGCSNGGSIAWAERLVPGSKGIGIDISQSKVDSTRSKGFDAVVLDATTLTSRPRVVNFCVLSHFLEHLNGYRDAKIILTNACTAARKFVVIRHPWFDSDGWLFTRGLKFYWSDWHGHGFHMDSLQVQTVLRDLRLKKLIKDFTIFGKGPVTNSQSDLVHSLDSPIDQGSYDSALHPPKPIITFPDGIYRELIAICAIDADLDDLARDISAGEKIYDSRSDNSALTPTQRTAEPKSVRLSGHSGA